MRRLTRMAVLMAVGCALSVASYATTSVRASVFPSSTSRGGTVIIHTGVVNNSAASEAVTVSIIVTNPGACVRNNVPTHTGSIAMPLSGQETRLATLSMKIPADACAGTYTVKVVVKNSSGTVIASHTTTYTVNPVP